MLETPVGLMTRLVLGNPIFVQQFACAVKDLKVGISVCVCLYMHVCVSECVCTVGVSVPVWAFSKSQGSQQ